MDLLGSVSLSYSASATGTAFVVVTEALDSWICCETIGWISGGAEGPEELEKRDPPRAGFFNEERDRSRSYAKSARPLSLSLQRISPSIRASIAS